MIEGGFEIDPSGDPRPSVSKWIEGRILAPLHLGQKLLPISCIYECPESRRNFIIIIFALSIFILWQVSSSSPFARTHADPRAPSSWACSRPETSFIGDKQRFVKREPGRIPRRILLPSLLCLFLIRFSVHLWLCKNYISQAFRHASKTATAVYRCEVCFMEFFTALQIDTMRKNYLKQFV